MDNPDYPRMVDLYARRGRPLPEDQPTPPEVLPGYATWIEHFIELSTERQIGFGGVGPIPGSAIKDLTKDWPPTEASFFYRTMRALDRAFTAHGTEYEEPSPEAVESDNPARDAFRAAMGSIRK